MGAEYKVPATPCLYQGEILEGVVRHSFSAPARELAAEGEEFEVVSYRHPRVIVVHSDCDLASDYRAREALRESSAENVSALLAQVLLCELFEEAEVRAPNSGLNSALWKNIQKNANERYHSLDESVDANGAQLPPLYLDFKKCFAIDTAALYEAIQQGGVHRRGVLSGPHLYDLLQRFFSYHARIGLPDD